MWESSSSLFIKNLLRRAPSLEIFLKRHIPLQADAILPASPEGAGVAGLGTSRTGGRAGARAHNLPILSLSLPALAPRHVGVPPVVPHQVPPRLRDVHDGAGHKLGRIEGLGNVAGRQGATVVEIIDLGRDVPTARIIEAAETNDADIIGTSTLLTTTMTVQKDLEENLKEAGLHDKYKTIVGGAPVTKRWADRIGADAYANDAVDGVRIAKELMKGR